MKKYDLEVKDGMIHVGLDTDKDGEDVAKMRVHLSEAVQEAIKGGKAVEGAKVVDFSFSGAKLMLKLDSDKDGQPALDIELDIMEALSEADLV